MKQITSSLFALVLVATGSVRADESLKGIACRSVHLSYQIPEVQAFNVSVRVTKSQPGSFFCVAGFKMGYCGIQEFADGTRHVIFSIWDAAQDKQTAEQRAEVLYSAPEVRVKRFGGEGTGAQSFYAYAWKLDTTYKFNVRATKGDGTTAFEARFFIPETGEWKHLATIQTRTEGALLRGLHSFVEDFKRDKISATLTRQAYFSEITGTLADGSEVSATGANFTADSNPVTNIDAGSEGREFFLATGGDIQNTHTPLWKLIELPKAK